MKEINIYRKLEEKYIKEDIQAYRKKKEDFSSLEEIQKKNRARNLKVIKKRVIKLINSDNFDCFDYNDIYYPDRYNTVTPCCYSKNFYEIGQYAKYHPSSVSYFYNSYFAKCNECGVQGHNITERMVLLENRWGNKKFIKCSKEFELGDPRDKYYDFTKEIINNGN